MPRLRGAVLAQQHKGLDHDQTRTRRAECQVRADVPAPRVRLAGGWGAGTARAGAYRVS